MNAVKEILPVGTDQPENINSREFFDEIRRLARERMDRTRWKPSEEDLRPLEAPTREAARRLWPPAEAVLNDEIKRWRSLETWRSAPVAEYLGLQVAINGYFHLAYRHQDSEKEKPDAEKTKLDFSLYLDIPDLEERVRKTVGEYAGNRVSQRHHCRLYLGVVPPPLLEEDRGQWEDIPLRPDGTISIRVERHTPVYSSAETPGVTMLKSVLIPSIADRVNAGLEELPTLVHGGDLAEAAGHLAAAINGVLVRYTLRAKRKAPSFIDDWDNICRPEVVSAIRVALAEGHEVPPETDLLAGWLESVRLPPPYDPEDPARESTAFLDSQTMLTTEIGEPGKVLIAYLLSSDVPWLQQPGTAICPECGTVFIQARKDQVYDKRACADRAGQRRRRNDKKFSL